MPPWCSRPPGPVYKAMDSTSLEWGHQVVKAGPSPAMREIFRPAILAVGISSTLILTNWYFQLSDWYVPRAHFKELQIVSAHSRYFHMHSGWLGAYSAHEMCMYSCTEQSQKRGHSSHHSSMRLLTFQNKSPKRETMSRLTRTLTSAAVQLYLERQPRMHANLLYFTEVTLFWFLVINKSSGR